MWALWSIAGRDTTRDPTTKKVARRFSFSRAWSSLGVLGEGPSS